ncbi:hypothetical protein FRB91_001747 [Serendipita sp. 411]|nr:hypothetical protein FRC18_002272 [Serendipita sp. 400]KAG8845434.1 hypothetical protein FRB91_001747 [Serendipita sp. 411]
MLPPAAQPKYGLGMGGPEARRDVPDYPNGRSHDAAATEDKVVRQGSLVIHGIRTVMLVEAVATDRQSLKSPTRLDRGTKSTGMVFQSPITNWQTLYRPGGGGGGGLARSKTVRSAKPLDSNGGIESMPNDSVDSGDTCGGALAAAASSFLVVESMRGVGIRLAIVIWID